MLRNNPPKSFKKRTQTLAIVAPSFDATPHTYIREHVSGIHPGATVLVTETLNDGSDLGAPVYYMRIQTLEESFLQTCVRKILQKPNLPNLSAAQIANLGKWMGKHKTSKMLVEFGTVGLRYIDVAHFLSIPLFVYFHGADATKRPRSKLIRKAYKRLFKVSSGIFVPSHYLKTRLQGLGAPEDKIFVTPHGIKVNMFGKTKRVPGRIVAVGRLVEKKGPLHSIRAFDKVRRLHPHCRLDIIGGGPLFNECVQEIERLKLQEAVTLHGEQGSEYVRQYLEQSEVFIQHSITAQDGDTESFGISLLEAMAAGLPVVTTRHNGFSETVIHDKTGLLVEEGNVQGMADAISYLVDSKEIGMQMGENGRSRAKNVFNAETCLQRVREVIEDLG